MRFERKIGFYEKYIKRLLDIICSLLFIIVFCWLYAIIAVIVRVKMGSPVLFKQPRPGIIKNGKETIFDMYKFRSMTDKRDENGELLPDADRLPAFGRLLRSTSLDELPELINILRGDMAIVGPRPLLVEYLPYYKEAERERHDVRPGLTGLAQVHGRNAIHSWEERFKYDLEYVNHVSFLMDLKVLFVTVGKVVKRSDIQVGSEIKAGRLDDARRENNDQKV